VSSSRSTELSFEFRRSEHLDDHVPCYLAGLLRSDTRSTTDERQPSSNESRGGAEHLTIFAIVLRQRAHEQRRSGQPSKENTPNK